MSIVVRKVAVVDEQAEDAAGAEDATRAEDAVEVSDAVFGCDFNEPLVHQAVVAYLAGGRAGTRAQKSRGEVSGGGRKPHRQKRTGRARAGSIRSPLWRGGGRTFAAKPQNHAVKLNRKMYRGAIRSILSELNRQGRIQAIPDKDLSLDEPKTAKLVARLSQVGLADVLILVNELDTNLALASRNLRGVDVRPTEALDPVSLVGADNVLITVAALEAIGEQLS